MENSDILKMVEKELQKKKGINTSKRKILNSQKFSLQRNTLQYKGTLHCELLLFFFLQDATFNQKCRSPSHCSINSGD